LRKEIDVNRGIGFLRFIPSGVFVFLCLTAFPVGVPAAADTEIEPLDINDTKWELKMAGVDAKGKKKEKLDTLILEKNTFIAEGFQRKGFTATNYSVSVQDDGTTSLSTMQVSTKEIAFWNAYVTPGTDRISGKVTITPKTGTPEQYVFDGKLIQGVVMTKVQKEAAAAAAEAAARKAEAEQAAQGAVEGNSREK
jgi:hypothetical protein